MKTHRHFTLMELLTVVAIGAFMLSMTAKLFTDGLRASRRARIQAENNQLVGVITKRWQKQFRKTSPDEWTMEGNVLKAGSYSARVAKNHLVLDDGASAKRIPLPDTMNCSFSIERNPVLADCAVLTLNIKSYYFHFVRTNSVRIVACGKRE